MAIAPTLTPLTLPAGTEWPGTPQLGVNLFSQYLSITGLEELGGINFGATTPASDMRDRPWFKTDISGNPIGWFSWNGSAWAQILFASPSGTTANRPSSAVTGQLYFDTDINVQLVYERSAWRTVSGSPGDVKEVKADTLAAALTANPGWVQDTASSKMVVGAADGTTGYEYGTTAGADSITLTAAQLPAHTHTLPMKLDQNGGDHNDSGSDTFINSGSGQSTNSFGDGDPIDTRQKTIYYWRLVKS